MSISEAKRRAAIENARKGTAANMAKVTGTWACAQCGKLERATVHQMRKTYCSKECMSEGYKVRMRGHENPNFRNASVRSCKVCEKEFHSYQKDRIYCGLSCRDTEAYQLRTNAKKDANHNEIVALLEAGGAVVKDMSKALFGVPDLLVWHHERWNLVEIKNPNTQYGKKGLNKTQKKWANDWQGGPVYIVRTGADVDKFLSGELSDLDAVGGYKRESLPAS